MIEVIIAAVVLAMGGQVSAERMYGTIEVNHGGVLVIARAGERCERDAQGRPHAHITYNPDSLPIVDDRNGGLMHGLGHVWDCLDNGSLDGSIMPVGGGRIVSHDVPWCWSSPAETAACWYAEQARRGGR